MTKHPVDIRPVLLDLASQLLRGGPADAYGRTLSGEDAVQAGFDIVAFIEHMDRKTGHVYKPFSL